MGTRSKVAVLPAAVRAELDRRIVEHAFSGYQALAEWLQAQGYQIADDSVQRYGARLRGQLDAVNLACHQVKALAAAGSEAGNTVDALTAITVQQIQQQALSILLRAAEPLASSDPANTDAESNEAGCTNSVDSDPTGKAPGEKLASAPVNSPPAILELRDLLRLTRMTVDLNRLMDAQRKRAEQFSGRPRQAAANQPESPTRTPALSEKICDAIRNALLTGQLFASASSATPPEPAELSAGPTEPLSDTAAPAKAQQCASEPTQPQLTAPHRIYPQLNDRSPFVRYDNPLGLALSCKPDSDFPLTRDR